MTLPIVRVQKIGFVTVILLLLVVSRRCILEVSECSHLSV